MRGDLDVLQAYRGWGYDSGVGSMSELPVVAVVIVLGAYIFNHYSL